MSNGVVNKLICGDNLEELIKLPKESIDLIYIDPPFFTHKQYEVVWGDEAEIRSFEDRWEGGIEHYIDWIRPRIEAMSELLKPTGSFYLHCDWHANAHLRIMLDKLFGANNFRNEIIWCYTSPGHSKQDFQRKHDTIYRYSKTLQCVFNQQYIPYKSGIHVRKRGDVLAYKSTLKKSKALEYEKRGKPIEDWWTDIYSADRVRSEMLGYPTQKPEALLERIIKASSNEGNLVLDAFCGCGTTCAVAQKLKRNWIGIDISPTAIKLVERRLIKLGAVRDRDFFITGAPMTVKQLKNLKPFEFQNWVINEMQGKHSKKKIGDMGIDGYIPKDLFRVESGIQVKQSDAVGRNVVDNFKAALERAKYRKGYIVAFGFGKGAKEEVARLKNAEEIDISLVTVEDLLSKKITLGQ